MPAGGGVYTAPMFTASTRPATERHAPGAPALACGVNKCKKPQLI